MGRTVMANARRLTAAFRELQAEILRPNKKPGRVAGLKSSNPADKLYRCRRRYQKAPAPSARSAQVPGSGTGVNCSWSKSKRKSPTGTWP